MTTTVTITGSGTPIPTADRAGPGVLVSRDGLHLQFDAGRATLTRLAATGTPAGELSAIFLTHYHSDHLVGLADIVLSRWVMDADDKAPSLPIVAPAGPTEKFCDHLLDVWRDDLAVRGGHNGRDPQPRFDVIGFTPPAEPTTVWSDRNVDVIAGPVRHEPVVGAVGYRIETPDGVVAISGDTRVCDEFAELARGADVVVYEAMRMDVVAQRPPRGHYVMEYHADTRLIGSQMAELGIPTVMLTHLIPPPSTDADRQAFEDEVRSGGYEGELLVCDDLTSVELPGR